jgi:hypothetical protein
MTGGGRCHWAAIAACAMLAALAPPAAATIAAGLDAGGLVLADSAGSADDVTLASNKTGVFVTVADKGSTLAPVCPLTSAKFHGFQCAPTKAVRIDAGAGADHIDASRLKTALTATLGGGSDLLIGGTRNDTIASLADGVRDVVACGPGRDVVQGVADPNDDVGRGCETAQRSFAARRLPKTVTVKAPSSVTLPIGRANVALGFEATLSTAPPKRGAHEPARTLARTTIRARTGRVTLHFTLPKVSSGFLSRRPDIRARVDVTAIAADGRRYPLRLHSRDPGPHPRPTTLGDNQVRLLIPAGLRHPRG